MPRILIWDVPTRLFHWTLVTAFAGAWLATGSDRWLSLHVFLGYLMLGMVGFRVIWGFAGTHYARFSTFWFGPRAALGYLRQAVAGHADRYLGHNPAGSLAIYLLLVLALVVGISGVFSLGGEEQQGAAAGWLSIKQGRGIKKLHELAAVVMLLVVIGHLTGVIVESLLHRENLARSMITGTKPVETPTPTVGPRWGVAALQVLAITVFALWWFSYALPPSLAGQWARSDPNSLRVKFVGAKLADNAQWREECGSCHGVFHPTLLPSRSWRRVMAEQDRHFGSDLGLDAKTSADVLAFLTANSADMRATEAAYKIDRSIESEEVPLRVTETGYWIKKHRDIPPEYWSLPKVKQKSNCGGCHLDADAGTFEDAAMRVPR